MKNTIKEILTSNKNIENKKELIFNEYLNCYQQRDKIDFIYNLENLMENENLKEDIISVLEYLKVEEEDNEIFNYMISIIYYN